MENIIIPDPEKLDQKIKKVTRDGPENLHILSDFDRTFTKCFVGNHKSSTSWSQFRNLDYFDEDYRNKAYEMFDHYRPIEISTIISEEERNREMSNWWKKHLDLLVEEGISQKIIKEVVNNGGITIRDKADSFLKTLKEKDIPIIFISSGLGDLIAETLKKEEVYSNNVHIISNFFEFDEDGKTTKFTNKIVIHSQNKREVTIKELSIYKELVARKNVLMMGDAIEDLRMIEGFDHKEVIKIGFLNEKEEERLGIFKENFDIIITNDGDMKYINLLLKKLL